MPRRIKFKPPKPKDRLLIYGDIKSFSNIIKNMTFFNNETIIAKKKKRFCKNVLKKYII